MSVTDTRATMFAETNISRVLVVCVLAVSVVAAHPAAQAPDSSAPVREITQVRGDLYRVRDSGQFTVFLVTPAGIILGDPLNLAAAKWLKEELANRFPDLPVRYVVQSYHSFERAGGGAAFKSTAELVGHQRFNDARMSASRSLPPSLASLDSNRDNKLAESELANYSLAAQLRSYDLNHDGVIVPGELYNEVEFVKSTYAGDRTIALGGKRVVIVNPGGAYRPGTAALLFPDERVLFSGDHPAVTSAPFSFRAASAKDVTSWMRAVAPLAFDTILSGHGDTMSRADFVALMKYLDDLVAGVKAGYKADMTLAQVQASPTFDVHRGELHDAARGAQIEAVYKELRAVRMDLTAVTAIRAVSGNSAYCDGYDNCASGGRTLAGAVGVRISLGQLAVVAETTLAGQFVSSREGVLYDDAFAHRDARGSLLFRYDGFHRAGMSYALLAGSSVTFGDTIGLNRVKLGLAPFAGRHLIAEQANRFGFTVGVDVASPNTKKLGLVVPVRLTRTFGEPTATWPGQLDLQAGIGLSLRLLHDVK